MIIEPQTYSVSPNDVLFGRGRSKDNHQGNKNYRTMVSKYKLLYTSKTAKKADKHRYANLVITEVKAQDPPGRFLRCNDSDNKWYEVDDEAVIKKVAQALREDAPSIRRRTSIKNNSSSQGPEGDDNNNSATSDCSTKKKTPSPPRKRRKKTNQDSDRVDDNRDKKNFHDVVVATTVKAKPEKVMSSSFVRAAVPPVAQEEEYEPDRPIGLVKPSQLSSLGVLPGSSEVDTSEDLQAAFMIDASDNSKKRSRERWSMPAASHHDGDVEQLFQAVTPRSSPVSCQSSFRDVFDSEEQVEEDLILPSFIETSLKYDLLEEEAFMGYHDILPLPLTPITTIEDELVSLTSDDRDYCELFDEILMLPVKPKH